MPRRPQSLHGLVILERVITRQAKIALELRNPRYVDAFDGAIHNGLNAAQDAARPFLGREPWWYDLLRGALSVELSMDESRQALLLVQSHRNAGADDGRLLAYHFSHWVFQTHALLEKSLYLLTLVYRRLVKRVHPDTYTEKMKSATAQLNDLKKSYSNVRNPLVHPIGGIAGAPGNERLWETHVLIGATIQDVANGYFETIPSYRSRWRKMLRDRMVVVLAHLDSAFKVAAEDVTNIDR